MHKTYLIALFGLTLCIPVPGLTQESREEKIQEFEAMFSQPGHTEEDLYQADRLLVTATGSLKPVHLAPSVASVITAEDIERMGATTLDEGTGDSARPACGSIRSHLGGEEVESAIRFFRKHSKIAPFVISKDSLSTIAEKEGDRHLIPGFGSRFGGIDPFPQQLVSLLGSLPAGGEVL